MADPVISCLAAAPCDYQPHLAISRVLSERLLVTEVTSNFIISPLTLRRVVWQQSIVTDVCKRVLYLLHEVLSTLQQHANYPRFSFLYFRIVKFTNNFIVCVCEREYFMFIVYV